MLRERVLHLLERNRGRIVTGGDIARLLSVSRTAVWKAIRALREDGHEIESLANSGYRLSEDSDGLSARAISDFLTTKAFGREMEILPTVPSTNRYLEGLDTPSIREGYAVLADGQTEGRGRKGRPFFSPAREGVYLSVLLKPQMPPEDVQMITICAAVAVCRALDAACGVRGEVKWVNDIYCGGRKLCGILTEAFVSAEAGVIDHVIVGVGINTGRVAPEVADRATSVQEINRARGIRNRLAAETLNQLEPVYHGCLRGDVKPILDAYTDRLFIVGREIDVGPPESCYRAKVLGLDERGGLLVERGDGVVCVVRGGEIHL
jgi:BirA family biotin operon repressor/biotin-[acetyl-CoA-carboxylase] ligase